MPKGTLYLLPTALGGPAAPFLPPATLAVLQRLRCFIAENPKSARAFLKSAGFSEPLQSVQISILNEHTPAEAVSKLIRPLLDGFDAALLSDAGCPAVADPGASLVRHAHAAGIRVYPLVGPSALLLALMASGLNGQRFAFHGYLPVHTDARQKKLAELEKESERLQVTQFFIEAPYRNDALLRAITDYCQNDTLVCVATDLTLASESIRTLSVGEWKRVAMSIDRRPTVFLLYREKRLDRSR